MTRKICLASLVSVDVITGCAGNVQTTETKGFLESFSKQGSELPYSVLRDDLVDANPNQANQFYALTDRGPNANHTGDYGKGKSFPVASYTPRIGLFEVAPGGNITMLKDILLKRPKGSLISG
ncbi:hypothetical protein [Psychromonas sp. MB-3u-54]|uniref:hypothetical protein n=1 Tax=Psychromonas sp. MB-3u-54 TaxID=2058319 RepID=UPI0018E2E7DC|nr:hypothetical protein [Psychromonas sp. MB-3u-54]